jgi:hypothetical protein
MCATPPPAGKACVCEYVAVGPFASILILSFLSSSILFLSSFYPLNLNIILFLSSELEHYPLSVLLHLSFILSCPLLFLIILFAILLSSSILF